MSTVLESEFSDLRLEVDRATGAPRRLWTATAPREIVNFDCSVSIVAGGEERRAPTGGLVYAGCEEITLAGDGTAAVRERVGLTSRVFDIDVNTTRPAVWSLTWRYELRETTPRLGIGLEIRSHTDDAIARNVKIELRVLVADRTGWRIHSPGNKIRPDLPLERLRRPMAVSPAGGEYGSAGVIAIEREDGPRTVVVWPLSTTEIGDILLSPTPSGVTVSWTTDVAGQPGAGAALSCSSLFLDVLHVSFATFLQTMPGILASLGITSPAAPPGWAAGASIYEVQIGFSVFAEGFRYEPYPEASDLLDDLDRIQELGYDTLQIMPRQPYPSYNVHDYADVTTSYGDEAVLRRIVDACHARGMHVILDVLLHGVVDREITAEMEASVRSGPFADRLGVELPDVTVLDIDDADAYAIGWSRHLLDFGPYWAAGSPPCLSG